MNVNKRIGRFKQWAGERMGGEAKTCLSDDFKAMETEMAVRHEGVDRIHKSMTSYVKAISKRNEGDDKEKTLPIAHLGSSMVSHGEDFDANSEYGQCLIMFGRTEERIARIQESYIAQATSSWLESLERSLTQLKDLQHARKKLDSRRLAYDTSLSKMEKAKKEDFRVEEELRSQKVKYEEASDDVLRRMQDIKEAESENVMDMETFLDAQLEYHERSREALLQLKSEWPRTRSSPSSNPCAFQHRPLISGPEELIHATEARPPIRSAKTVMPHADTSSRDSYANVNGASRPVLNRVPTFEGPAQLRQEQLPAASQWIQQRTTSENLAGFGRRSSTQVGSGRISADPYADSEESRADVQRQIYIPSNIPRQCSVQETQRNQLEQHRVKEGSSSTSAFPCKEAPSTATAHEAIPSYCTNLYSFPNWYGTRAARPRPYLSTDRSRDLLTVVPCEKLLARLLPVLCSEHPDFPEPVAQLRPLPISISIHPLFERAISTRLHLGFPPHPALTLKTCLFYSLSLTPLSLKVTAPHHIGSSDHAPPNTTPPIAKHPIQSHFGRIHANWAHTTIAAPPF
ncbi:uncharacterized protein N7515_000880 [Penicillium bovifimosum]|uniref:BAR domain-containing protein n=1 Tax=Penicillium bovifimosum TaxID=126998 RepID=A0A9W9HFP2_9EURO|nr:uncharacterized protein N7515_000880 [Penicillium bovifimosum]KAJ5146316.1 hypothetical protein N7515_000880 [Penicillium bovifimosum]